MTDWIADNWINIAVAAVICIIVFFAVRSIVKDRRYSKNGITRLMKKAGFIVDECYCFQSGHIERELDSQESNAKEILIIAHKGSAIYRLSHAFDSIEKCWK